MHSSASALSLCSSHPWAPSRSVRRSATTDWPVTPPSPGPFLSAALRSPLVASEGLRVRVRVVEAPDTDRRRAVECPDPHDLALESPSGGARSPPCPDDLDHVVAGAEDLEQLEPGVVHRGVQRVRPLADASVAVEGAGPREDIRRPRHPPLDAVVEQVEQPRP